MRWATYDRKIEQIAAAEDVVEAYTQAFHRKLANRGLGR
jgi:hypothetical protein